MRFTAALTALAIGCVWSGLVATDGAEARAAQKDPAAKAEAKAERQTEKAAKDQQATENREAQIDRREERQAQRIERGIEKGYLTPDEIAKLQAQQNDIATAESSFRSDGKLTRAEHRKLQRMLNKASECIWAEKHDQEGKQMPVFRLGKNIFAKDSLTQQLENTSITGQQARAMMKDFHRTVQLKRELATKDLTSEERAKLQAEYNDLLNKYFELRQPAPAAAAAKAATKA